MDVLDIQRRLKALGFDSGPLDGIWGRRTLAAVKAFQTVQSLEVDGIVGPKTRAALIKGETNAPPPSAASVEPVWLGEARRWMGMREIAGAASNPTILAWGRAAERWYVNDDIPWCGAFVFGVLAAALPDEPLPPHPLYARNWSAFGVSLAVPAPGAVLVFERGPNAGHVGFYAGEDDGRFRVLGGNQSNAVSEAWIAKTRLLAARWPRSVPPPSGGRLRLGGGGPTSTEEA